LFYIYFGVLKARQQYSEVYIQRKREIWKIPAGPLGLYIVCFGGSVFNCAAIYYVFALPLTPDISPFGWRVWLSGISFIVIIIGGVIYKFGESKVNRVNIEAALAKYAVYDLPPEE
jgi:hypothetical protein